MIRAIFFISLFFTAPVLHAQRTPWKLKTSKDSISIYTAQVSWSPINAIKVETNLSCTMSQLVAVILDINATAEWVYSTKSVKVLKVVSPGELYYYSELSFPWPASNRDFIAHITITQDPVTKVVTVDAGNNADMVPVKAGVVRVSKSMGKWLFTPLSPNLIHVSYELECDPAGSLPSWLVNMFSTRGPYESFRKLKLQVQKPVYHTARYGFIKD